MQTDRIGAESPCAGVIGKPGSRLTASEGITLHPRRRGDANVA
jgi:hypothetical protein